MKKILLTLAAAIVMTSCNLGSLNYAQSPSDYILEDLAGTMAYDGLSIPVQILNAIDWSRTDIFDPAFSGSWTSETFKIVMMMATDDRSLTSQWHAMRQFVFDHGSFRPANDPEAPFAARIEITDPFSRQSPAWEWGWWKYADRGLNPFTKFILSDSITPAGVSTLKKDDFLVW